MFSNRFKEILSRLEKFSDLRKSPIMGKKSLARKLKNIYSSFLFLILKPLINRQNAYNKAVSDLNNQIIKELDGVNKAVSDLSNQMIKELDGVNKDIELISKGIKNIKSKLDRLEYKIFVGFPPGFDYSKFEDQFRGPEGIVKERQQIYLGYLNKQKSVLDIGCGRGEFLELLRDSGIKAFGVDSNLEMVNRCKDKGLNVELGDAIEYLDNFKGSLGNVFLSMIVEHLDFKDIYRIIKAAWEKMEKDSVIIIETINPNSFYAQSRAYVIDPTHVNLLSPETLSYTFQKIGFRNLRIIYKSPVPKEQRLKLINEVGKDKELRMVIDKINDDLKLLDGIIFGNLEYAIMGVK